MRQEYEDPYVHSPDADPVCPFVDRYCDTDCRAYVPRKVIEVPRCPKCGGLLVECNEYYDGRHHVTIRVGTRRDRELALDSSIQLTSSSVFLCTADRSHNSFNEEVARVEDGGDLPVRIVYMEHCSRMTTTPERLEFTEAEVREYESQRV